jgi:4-hydroxyphenylpyruvate dioxygenase-like putative hemolysin
VKLLVLLSYLNARLPGHDLITWLDAASRQATNGKQDAYEPDQVSDQQLLEGLTKLDHLSLDRLRQYMDEMPIIHERNLAGACL